MYSTKLHRRRRRRGSVSKKQQPKCCCCRQWGALLHCLLLWLFVLASDECTTFKGKSARHDMAVQGFVIPSPFISSVPPPFTSNNVFHGTKNFRSVKIMNAHTFGRTTSRSFTATTRQQGPMKLHMCVCIHCARVVNCSAYFFVESKHEQPHIATNPTFTPRDGSPTIHVNVRTERSDGSDEMKRMWQEHEDETQRAREKSAIERKDKDTNATDLHGETKYTVTPITTYEYDVVACLDYVEDRNCWVRNMPDEIKRANPNFVPT
jgi:hypothetical protein